MSKVYELRGMIYSMFDSEAQYAEYLGWARQKLSKITNGVKEPNIDELNTLAKTLGRSVDEMAQIFLSKKSPNRQRSA